LYGRETTDQDRPGAKGGSEADKENKDLLVGGMYTSLMNISLDYSKLQENIFVIKNPHILFFILGKVRSFIICSECGKRRVIYCK
jgi:hypothetical protein